MIYNDSNNFLPQIVTNPLNASDASSLSNHNLTLDHFDQSNSFSSLPSVTNMSQLLPRSNEGKL